MADVKQRFRELFGSGDGTERIEAFSDAVFAIALTLLVLDVALPEGGAEDRLLDELVALWPELAAYVLSFVIIAVHWVTHHRKFRVIERFDTGLLWINLMLLMFVALVPFPTSVLSEYGDQEAAVVLYAVAVAVLSLLQAALWSYAYRRRLLAPSVDASMHRYVLASILPAPVVFLASIPVALTIGPDWALSSWLLIVPLSIAVDRVAVSRSRG